MATSSKRFLSVIFFFVFGSAVGLEHGYLAIGDGTDAAGFDPEIKLAFSSNGEGTLTVIREDSKDKFNVLENVRTQRGARAMTLDPKTHKIYLSTAQFGPAPAPTAERPRPRPGILPNSFVILVYGR